MTRIGEAGRELFPTFSVPPRPRNRVLSYPVNLMSITQLLPENYGFEFRIWVTSLCTFAVLILLPYWLDTSHIKLFGLMGE